MDGAAWNNYTVDPDTFTLSASKWTESDVLLIVALPPSRFDLTATIYNPSTAFSGRIIVGLES